MSSKAIPFVLSPLVRRVREAAYAQWLRAGESNDLQLFATTFAAGFLFVSLFLA